MRYEWDVGKRAANRRKHDVDLIDGIAALRDPFRLEWIDDRIDYGEERTCTIGIADERLLLVVHTMRGSEVVRLISTRKATKNEQNAYIQHNS